MIYIGMEDPELQQEVQFDEDGNPISNHGDGYDEEQKEKIRNKTVYIPEKRIEQFKADYDCVVVMDFGDEYHLSEEEREEKNRFYKAFRKFSKYKHKYRKLDEYVEAMREALKCLDFVAENNGVYSPEEFKKLFFRDKIYINGLVFPKYSGKNKKNISWDYVTEFILSDRDPREILPSKEENFYSEDELEELEGRLFDEGELDRITRELTPEEITEQNKFYDVEERDPGDDNIVIFMNKKQTKKYIKGTPEFLNEIKEMRQAGKSLDSMARLAYDLTSADIEEIARYDQQHNYVSKSDFPKFKGDLTNDDDYYRYMMQLEEFENSSVKDNYAGKMKTLDEINEIELKKVLESHSWNLRNLYGNKDKEERLKRLQKKERKREKELKEKLIRVQNRRKRRMGEDIEDEPKKKKKKKKKEKRDIERKKEKAVSKLEQDTRESIDELLLTAVDQLGNYDSFKSYEKDVQDWSWENIMNGD